MLNFYFDAGTSNCRGYLIRNGQAVGSARRSVGSKDVSISGNPMVLIRAMKEIYDDVLAKNGVRDETVSRIYASGMVTSPFGLCEVPHALLPLTVQRLAKELYPFREEQLFHREFLLIRGAKTIDIKGTEAAMTSGAAGASGAAEASRVSRVAEAAGAAGAAMAAARVNNTRGEEIEVLGMLERIPKPWREAGSLVLLPGSHTHAVKVKGEAITDILSCFSGEMFHALSTATILSGEIGGEAAQADLPGADLPGADLDSIEQGCRLLLEYGIARAVYIVHATKLFELAGNAARRDMLSGIVYGTAAQSLALHLRNHWKEDNRLALYGSRDVVDGYLRALSIFTPHMEILPVRSDGEAGEAVACSVLGALKVIREVESREVKR